MTEQSMSKEQFEKAIRSTQKQQHNDMLQIRTRMQDAFFASKCERLGAKYLNRWTSGVYSQTNEDAIIAQIFQRIGAGEKRFLEIGIGQGIECNTRLLLEQGWSGVWIEGSEENFRRASSYFKPYVEAGQLKIQNAFLTKENINDIVEDAGISGDVDFLSVDIDMNTSHVWRELDIEARCACIEYNASYPPGVRFETAYQSDAVWRRDNYFGASLDTLNDIATEKKLSLVGCDINGVNGFFVSTAETEERFLAPCTVENHYETPWYGVGSSRGHARHIPSN